MKITPTQYAINLYESTKDFGDTELEKIVEYYQKYHKEQKSITQVKVTSANKLDSETIEKITEKIKIKFNKPVDIEEKTDSSLIGGIIIKINEDILIDGSVKRKLENFKKELQIKV